MEKIELFEQMKTMSKDELLRYLGSVRDANIICNLVCGSAVLFFLLFTNIYTFIFTIASILFFTKLSVGLDTTKSYINELLKKKR